MALFTRRLASKRSPSSRRTSFHSHPFPLFLLSLFSLSLSNVCKVVSGSVSIKHVFSLAFSHNTIRTSSHPDGPSSPSFDSSPSTTSHASPLRSFLTSLNTPSTSNANSLNNLISSAVIVNGSSGALPTDPPPLPLPPLPPRPLPPRPRLDTGAGGSIELEGRARPRAYWRNNSLVKPTFQPRPPFRPVAVDVVGGRLAIFWSSGGRSAFVSS